jgi:hypothetical protein
MNRPPGRQVPTAYRLRVDGHLDDHWAAWFGGLTLTHHTDGTTSLSGVVSDQAQLHGLLMKVRDLGVTLISVEGIDPNRPKPASVTSGRSPGNPTAVDPAVCADPCRRSHRCGRPPRPPRVTWC